jgi:hypothetical protein
MDFFRLFAGSRRASLRDLIRLRARRDGVRLAVNAESARLLHDQPDAAATQVELLRHFGPDRRPSARTIIASGLQNLRARLKK